MTRRRYVWRVTATFEDGRTETRHFQSEAAARHRAAVLLHAVEPANPDAAFYPRAEAVVIERSAPVDGWQVVSS